MTTATRVPARDLYYVGADEAEELLLTLLDTSRQPVCLLLDGMDQRVGYQEVVRRADRVRPGSDTAVLDGGSIVVLRHGDSVVRVQACGNGLFTASWRPNDQVRRWCLFCNTDAGFDRFHLCRRCRR